MCLCESHLHAMTQAVQLLVVDWLAAVRWAGLSTGSRLRRREDLVAAWDSSHRRENTDFSPGNFLLVHLHRLRRTKSKINTADSNYEFVFLCSVFPPSKSTHTHNLPYNHTTSPPAKPFNEGQRLRNTEQGSKE